MEIEFQMSPTGTYMISCVAQTPDHCEEDTMRKQLIVARNGMTDDSSCSSSGGNSHDGQSGEYSNGGTSFPDILFCGISIPNPLDLIDEYIKLIKIMIILSNYKL
jgi:hypothetical protein